MAGQFVRTEVEPIGLSNVQAPAKLASLFDLPGVNLWRVVTKVSPRGSIDRVLVISPAVLYVCRLTGKTQGSVSRAIQLEDIQTVYLFAQKERKPARKTVPTLVVQFKPQTPQEPSLVLRLTSHPLNGGVQGMPQGWEEDPMVPVRVLGTLYQKCTGSPLDFRRCENEKIDPLSIPTLGPFKKPSGWQSPSQRVQTFRKNPPPPRPPPPPP
eukprot:Hpha_TRINITY_DN456_c0_g1::TRINITY_DN456_c0_g1_i1::g.27532::m.27532